MIIMEDKITLINENNEQKDYKLLAIIDIDYQYIIYTDLDNNDFKHNLYAIKVKDINLDNNILPISDEEWNIINNEYMSIIK